MDSWLSNKVSSKKTEDKLMASQELYSGKLLFKCKKLISEENLEHWSLIDLSWKGNKTQRGVGYK